MPVYHAKNIYFFYYIVTLREPEIMYIVIYSFYFICFVYILILLLIFDYLIFLTFYINGKVVFNMTL